LARHLFQQSSVFDGSTPKGLQGQPVVLQVKSSKADDADVVEQQRQETLLQIASACSWLAWYCRLESRRADSLPRLTVNLHVLRRRIELESHSVSDCVAYYLQIAPSMFAYYLLLWELVQTVEFDPIVQHV
jgi:hypothetical protein